MLLSLDARSPVADSVVLRSPQLLAASHLALASALHAEPDNLLQHRLEVGVERIKRQLVEMVLRYEVRSVVPLQVIHELLEGPVQLCELSVSRLKVSIGCLRLLEEAEDSGAAVKHAGRKRIVRFEAPLELPSLAGMDVLAE